MDTVVIAATTTAPLAEVGQLVTISLAAIAALVLFGVIIGNRRKNAARRAS